MDGSFSIVRCKGVQPFQSHALPSARVADAMRLFTTGMGAKRRVSTVYCTGTWLTEDSMLSLCRTLFYMHRHRRNGSVLEVTTRTTTAVPLRIPTATLRLRSGSAMS